MLLRDNLVSSTFNDYLPNNLTEGAYCLGVYIIGEGYSLQNVVWPNLCATCAAVSRRPPVARLLQVQLQQRGGVLQIRQDTATGIPDVVASTAQSGGPFIQPRHKKGGPNSDGRNLTSDFPLVFKTFDDSTSHFRLCIPPNPEIIAPLGLTKTPNNTLPLWARTI